MIVLSFGLWYTFLNILTSVNLYTKRAKILEDFCIPDITKQLPVSDMPDTSPDLESEGVPYILCVREERPVLTLVCKALEESGYKVVYVDDSEYALFVMTISQPDVLLVDLTWRDSEGWQTYQVVKKDVVLKSVIVIDVSARSTQLRYSKAGHSPAVNDDIPQPADIERLVHSVKVLARKQ